MRSESPHGQADVEIDVVQVLSHGRVMTTQEITQAVKDRLVLSPTDQQKANKRDNESKIDQIIANALQDRRRLCRDNLIERVARGEFRITPKGRDYLSTHEERLKKAIALFNDLLPDAE